MKKFKYRYINFKNKKLLRKLGKEGWEVIGSVPGGKLLLKKETEELKIKINEPVFIPLYYPYPIYYPNITVDSDYPRWICDNTGTEITYGSSTSNKFELIS